MWRIVLGMSSLGVQQRKTEKGTLAIAAMQHSAAESGVCAVDSGFHTWWSICLVFCFLKKPNIQKTKNLERKLKKPQTTED